MTVHLVVTQYQGIQICVQWDKQLYTDTIGRPGLWVVRRMFVVLADV